MKNIIDSPLCLCNNIEIVKHFSLDCPNYNNQRITLDTLLYGNSTPSLQANSDVFEAVQLFLKQTNRF